MQRRDNNFFARWFYGFKQKRLACLDFEIPNKKEHNYSKLLLLSQIRPDLMQINDMINHYIDDFPIIKIAEQNHYTDYVYVESSFLFWDTSEYEARIFEAKLILKDTDEKSKFFFRINNFYDSKDKGLCFDISFFPAGKDSLYETRKKDIDIYEFDEVFNDWTYNVRLFNNFDIRNVNFNENIDIDLLFSSNRLPEEKLNYDEIEKFKAFLLELKHTIEKKRNRSNFKSISKLVSEIDYIDMNLDNFTKKKLIFYLNSLFRKIRWLGKELAIELVKEVFKRALLGPG